MIKVIPKVFEILELLADRERVALKDIAAQTGLKKTTVSNILHTLVGLGYLEKGTQGMYAVGPRLYMLSAGKVKKDALQAIGEETVRNLAGVLNEAVVLTVLEEQERSTLVEATFTNEGIALITKKEKGGLYSTATGRVLLSGMDEAGLRQLMDKRGLPQQHEWPDITSFERFKAGLKKIRIQQIESMTTPAGQVQAVAMPIYSPDKKVRAALGVYLPVNRFTGGHKKIVLQALKQAGHTLSAQLLK